MECALKQLANYILKVHLIESKAIASGSVRKCKMAADTFCIDSIVYGYHEYQSIWHHPLADGELVCKREAGKFHDPQAVAIKKIMDGNLQIVGHVPR